MLMRRAFAWMPIPILYWQGEEQEQYMRLVVAVDVGLSLSWAVVPQMA